LLSQNLAEPGFELGNYILEAVDEILDSGGILERTITFLIFRSACAFIFFFMRIPDADDVPDLKAISVLAMFVFSSA
jgi:hypothetical protein